MGDSVLTYTTLTDEALIAKINADDRQAYAVLLQRYTHKVIRMAYAIVKSEDEAQDVAQDVFVSLLVALENWDSQGKAKFSSWIYRITLNKAIDYKRKRKPTTSTEQIDIPAQSKEGYHRVLESQRAAAMQAQLNRLPDAQKEAIFLYYYKEMTIPAIARQMESTEVAVRSLLKRGKALLRDRIGQGDLLFDLKDRELV